MKNIILQVAVATVLWFAASHSVAEPTYNWKEDGERLHYVVRWGWLKAGEAEVLYRPSTAQQTYDIVARAWTTTGLFHLRERLAVEGTHQEPGFLPFTFQQMQIENDFRANKEVVFDHANEQASYDNKRNEIGPEQLTIPTNARDFLSVLFYLRQGVRDVTGQIPELPVVSLHRQYIMQMEVGKPETMDAANATIAVRKITPHLKALTEEKDAKDSWAIWITDDEERLPVKIAYKSRFGTFTAVLTNRGSAALLSAAPADVPEDGPLFRE